VVETFSGQPNNVVPYRYADCTVQHSTYAGQMCQEPGLVIPQFTVGGPGPSLIIADPTAVQIYKHPSATETGVYKKPIPFGGMGKPVDQEGFSDHVPTPCPSHTRGTTTQFPNPNSRLTRTR